METVETDSSNYSDLSDETNEEDKKLIRDFLNDTRVADILAEQAKEKNRLKLLYGPLLNEKINTLEDVLALMEKGSDGSQKSAQPFLGMLSESKHGLKEIAEVIKQLKVDFTPEEDTNIKQAQMYKFYFCHMGQVPGWTTKDRTEFFDAILRMSRDIKRKELRNTISELQKEIKQLDKKTLNELALPLESQEYDWKVLANSLTRVHTEQECLAVWTMLLHPKINKTSWSEAEQQELHEIATANNYEDWDTIAKQLNTRRSAYQCFVSYRTPMADNTLPDKWSKEEMEHLQLTVNFHEKSGHIPWDEVASVMEHTQKQVYNKYMTMAPSTWTRKFLKEEDVVLLNYHEKYGNDFQKIAELMVGRTAEKLKHRFNLLTKLRQSTTWLVKDDRKLLQIMTKSAVSKILLSSITKHFPGKNRANIWLRYIKLTKSTKIDRLMDNQWEADAKKARKNLDKAFERTLKKEMMEKLTRQFHAMLIN